MKSHGSADALGFASAIDLAIDMGGSDMIARILSDRAGVSSIPGRWRLGSDHPGRRGEGGCLVKFTRSVVLGCGSYLPGKILTNYDLAKMVDTSDDWIVERTGIKLRHIARDGETTSDLALEAAQSRHSQLRYRGQRNRRDHRRDHDAG